MYALLSSSFIIIHLVVGITRKIAGESGMKLKHRHANQHANETQHERRSRKIESIAEPSRAPQSKAPHGTAAQGTARSHQPPSTLATVFRVGANSCFRGRACFSNHLNSLTIATVGASVSKKSLGDTGPSVLIIRCWIVW